MWWVLKDVCAALGLSNPTVVAQSLDDNEVTKFNLGSQAGETYLVSEPGVYSLVGKSRKPETKRFKRWVNQEVLPPSAGPAKGWRSSTGSSTNNGCRRSPGQGIRIHENTGRTVIVNAAVLAVGVAAWWWILTHEGCVRPLGNLLVTMIASLIWLTIHEKGDGDGERRD